MSLLNMLGIQHPIILAPMAGISTPTLAADVSNAGGLGSLGLGANSIETARQQIVKTQTLTQRPFQVNFFCHKAQKLDPYIAQQWINYLAPEFERLNVSPPTQLKCIYPSFLDHNDYLKLVLETRPKAVSFHFGLPLPHQLTALKEAGIITMVSATNLAEAQAIEEASVDIIIAQGIEAGGHRGMFNPKIESAISTFDLIELIHKYCRTPIIAAGGIMNGSQAKQALKLGAQAVQLGTAFIQCKSSNASTAYREALFNQSLTQISSSISGRPARGLINRWHTHIDHPERPIVPAYPYTYDLAKQLYNMMSQNNQHDFAAFWAGSHVSQIRAIEEAKDLINTLVLEMSDQSNYV